MSGNVRSIASKADLDSACSSHGGLTVILIWAPWHEPSVQMTKVIEALAGQHSNVVFAKGNADECPELSTAVGADQVPYTAYLGPSGEKIDAVPGANPPQIVEKTKLHANRPFQAASASGAAVGGGQDDLNARLKKLINFDKVMLFMKGSKIEPFCKFSKVAIAILNKHGCEYSTFDILQDEEVRTGLKDYSNWKTYPQLYIEGELIGGVDIIKEMDEDGSLAEAIPSDPLQKRLESLINQEPVMLFMKGDPDTPRCGFSGKIVNILKEESISYGSFDILSDEDVRQGLKEYSKWPTYPQLYAKGKLIGGLDIIQELHEEGGLKEEMGM